MSSLKSDLGGVDYHMVIQVRSKKELMHSIRQLYCMTEQKCSGIWPGKTEVRLVKNLILIASKEEPGFKQTIEEISPGNGQEKGVFRRLERSQFRCLLSQEIAALLQCIVISIQSEICIQGGLKIEVIRLDTDIEKMFTR